MPPTVYPFNRRGVILMLLGSLAFVAGGVWLLLSPDTPKRLIGGVLGVALFGAGAVVLVRRLINPRPELTITDEGLQGWATAPVAWTEVRHVTTRSVAAGPTTKTMIEVVLHDPATYVARASGTVRLAAQANLKAGFSPVNIPPVGRGVSLQDVVQAMRVHHPALTVLG